MKTYKIRLTALTPIVLTQRESQQLIKGIDFNVDDNGKFTLEGDYAYRPSMLGNVVDVSKITTVYAAYYNGSHYYIPGSTIKGNILKHIENNRGTIPGSEIQISDFKLLNLENVKITNKMTKFMYQHNVQFSGDRVKKDNNNLTAPNHKIFQQKVAFPNVGVMYFEEGAIFEGKVRVSEASESIFVEQVLNEANNFDFIVGYKSVMERLKAREVSVYKFDGSSEIKTKLKQKQLKLNYQAFYGNPGKSKTYITKQCKSLLDESVELNVDFKKEEESGVAYHEIKIGNSDKQIRIAHFDNNGLEVLERSVEALALSIEGNAVMCIGGQRGYHSAFEQIENKTTHQENNKEKFYNQNGLWQINDQLIGYVKVEVVE